MKKRIVPLLLALVMMVSLLPVQVFADEVNTANAQADVTQEQEQAASDKKPQDEYTVDNTKENAAEEANPESTVKDEEDLAVPQTVTAIPQNAAVAWDGSSATEPAQENDVYLIGTGAELAWFAQRVNSSADYSTIKGKLTADIDLNGKEWTPIGRNVTRPFAGQFDGDGHTVKGLSITGDLSESGRGNPVGLFGMVLGGSASAPITIQNLTVRGSINTTWSKPGNQPGIHAGGVIGYCQTYNATTYVALHNVVSDVNISFEIPRGILSEQDGPCVGGLVGDARWANVTIENCANTGSLTAKAFAVGGLVGRLNMGSIQRSYNAGTILLKEEEITAIGGQVDEYDETFTLAAAGGLIGVFYDVNFSRGGSVTDCYNVGSVSAQGKQRAAGGLAGIANGVMTNCYSAGVVTSEAAGFSGSAVGTINYGVQASGGSGFAGKHGKDNAGTLKAYNIYAVGTSVIGRGKLTDGAIVGKTETELKDLDIVLGSGFKGDTANVNNGFPVLVWQPGDAPEVTVTGIKITTPPTKTEYVEGEDFDTSGMVVVAVYSDNSEKKITDYTVSDGTSLTKAVTKVTVKYGEFTAEQAITVKAGSSLPVWDGSSVREPQQAENGTYLIGTAAELAWFAAKVNSGETRINGKLTADIDLGSHEWTPIGKSKFNGTFDGDGHVVRNLYINSSSYPVGLFGYVSADATVTKLGVTGSVTCTNTKFSQAGGIAGYMWNGATISQCFSTVDVTTNIQGGGIAGYTQNGAKIIDCYATGNVTAASTNECYVGGICGSAYDEAGTGVVITNCYSTGLVTGTGKTKSCVGGVSAAKNATYTNCFYIDGNVTGESPSKGVTGKGEAKTAEELKADAMLTTLGDAFKKDAGNINNGYPVLVWQVSEACTDHTPGAAVRENEVPATCTKDGSHDEVIYCTVCKTEISRKTITDKATGHKAQAAVKENVKAPTCTAAGSHDDVVYCSVCQAEISRTTVTDKALGHDWDSATGKCKRCETACDHKWTNGKCDTCGYACQHVGGDAVKEKEVPATCTKDGSHDEVVYCTICKAEVSRKTVTDKALGHKEQPAVKENVKAPTCTVDGSHDEVVYCSVCKEEVSRTNVVDKATGHKWDAGVVTTQPTTGKEGVKTFTCTVCKETKTETIDKLGEDKKDESAANEAINLINGIGTVTKGSKDKIDAARKAYDGLTEDQKKLVPDSVLKTLTDAEAAYAKLVQDKADQDAADAVIAKIDAIGTVTLKSKKAIDAARKAYDKLTAAQQARVSNYAALTAAETTYAKLVQDKADQDAADAVIAKIDVV